LGQVWDSTGTGNLGLLTVTLTVGEGTLGPSFAQFGRFSGLFGTYFRTSWNTKKPPLKGGFFIGCSAAPFLSQAELAASTRHPW
jgi:hypothetical protein